MSDLYIWFGGDGMRSCSAFWINASNDSPVAEFFDSYFLVFRCFVLEELYDRVARVSLIIVPTLPESTKTFVAVFPNTTGRLIDSIGAVESAEDTDATQLSSFDEK